MSMELVMTPDIHEKKRNHKLAVFLLLHIFKSPNTRILLWGNTAGCEHQQYSEYMPVQMYSMWATK